MRGPTFRGVLAVALAFGAQLVLPGAVSAAGGIGIYPVSVELADALRGAEYPRTTTIVNREDRDLTFTASFDGEIAGWLSVRAVDQADTPIIELAVPARSETRYVLHIAVPGDAANGRHTGKVLFQGRPADDGTDQSGMGVSIGIRADVVVDVTGTQNLSGVVRELRIDDAEVGQPPVRLRMQFENNGNVQATPKVQWTIRDGHGATVGDVSTAEMVVQPGTVENIVSEWDMGTQPQGEYVASVTVSLGATAIYRHDHTFALLPVGTLTRSGVLERIILEGTPRPGGVAKIVGAFTNNGQIDTRATFVAEVYHDGELIQTVESRERVVVVSQLALLEAFVDVKEAGDYTIRGKVNYEGRETAVRQLDFTVAAGAVKGSQALPETAAGDSWNGQPVWAWLAGGLALIGGVVGLAFVLGRGRGGIPVRRRSAPKQPRRAE